MRGTSSPTHTAPQILARWAASPEQAETLPRLPAQPHCYCPQAALEHGKECPGLAPGCSPAASTAPAAQPSKAAVTPQHRQGRQHPRPGSDAGGTTSWHSPRSWHSPGGCCVTALSLPQPSVGGSGCALAASRGCSRAALTARKVGRSRSSMATPPRGVGVLWRHCGQGTQRCSLATPSRRFRQAWQKLWPQWSRRGRRLPRS